MNIFRSVVALLFFINFFSSVAFSQQDSIDLNSIITKTAKISTNQPFEKVHIHFDKPYYSVGDTIWFKAYVTGLENQPSGLSKIVYIEVISERDSLVKTLKLPVKGGVAPGSIELPETNYKQGNYRIRGYTKWMYNFGTEYFFDKIVPVGNALNKKLITHVSFAGGAGKDSKSTVRVQYRDGEGNPYAGKRVSWTIEEGYDVLSKGRETTDKNGFITVNLNNQKHDLTKGELKTVLSVDNTKTLENAFSLTKAASKVDLQFFPEGGELVNGISTKVAFKAIKSDGLGQDIKGEIVDNEGKTVVTFASQHLGMGSFTLFPELSKTYKANIITSNGSKQSFTLPAVKPEGIILQINSDPDNLIVRIAANTAFFDKNKNKGFYLVGQTGTVVYYGAQTLLKTPVITAAIPKSKFPPGILQLTLFTSSGVPVNERLVFIRPGSAVDIKVSSDRKVYAPKQKVELSVSANESGKPVLGNFSIAVIDEAKVPFDDNSETTILSNLLLTSDLKGFVEKPNYYFHEVNEKKLSDLDVLMLTQGFRRFAYTEILKDNYPPVSFLPEQGIEVTGTLRSKNGMPINKGNMRISIPDKHFSAYSVTDPEGQFKFSDLVLADSSKVIVDSKGTANSRNMMIMIDGNYFPAITKGLNTPAQVHNIDSVLSPYLQNSKKQYRNSHLLQEVVINEKAVSRPSHSDHPALAGLSTPDHLISGDRFNACNDLLMCLQGSLSGLTLDREAFYVTRDYNQGRRTPVALYINGMEVDLPALSSVRPLEVESIEVFLKDDLGVVNRASQTRGVLVINTKKAPKGMSITKEQLMEILPQSNVVNLTGIGYSKVKEFYSPKYSVPSNMIINDLRTTVYWNPLVITNKDGKASMSYFNADGRGTYKVIIEGLDSDGKLGRSVYRYTVK